MMTFSSGKTSSTACHWVRGTVCTCLGTLAHPRCVCRAVHGIPELARKRALACSSDVRNKGVRIDQKSATVRSSLTLFLVLSAHLCLVLFTGNTAQLFKQSTAALPKCFASLNSDCSNCSARPRRLAHFGTQCPLKCFACALQCVVCALLLAVLGVCRVFAIIFLTNLFKYYSPQMLSMPTHNA